MLIKMAEGNCKIIFLETICNDDHIIERNIRLKVQQSPDYAEQPDFEAGCRDFRNRLAYYEKVYEPVEEGSYIKMIDMALGQGGQIQVNNISGYLPGRIVFFLDRIPFNQSGVDESLQLVSFIGVLIISGSWLPWLYF